ncbi:universal stress protein [Hymenobacter profundi]|uniref:Universal stress protein n=1 Tax=Hymenobacter profundi TaxID=1982110 RepID=A0ABS6WUB0_9BACT|nr:universal stress protein [Hymenobacter profundi]MBW3127165.1 universal stress protein [Hymenobacter profundi]
MSYHRILIYADASPQCYHAAKAGLELAAALSAEAALVTVLDDVAAIGNIDAGQTHAEAEALLLARAEELLDQLAALAAPGLRLTRFLPWGQPAEQVLATVEAWPADLLVVGTQGRHGLLGLLLGGAAEHLMERAHCPVLVVPLR